MKIRDAQTVVGMLERGQVAVDLSKALTETLAIMADQSAVNPKAKVKGRVRLDLKIEIEGGMVTIAADIDAKAPKPIRGVSFYWVNAEGELSTEHPQQGDMFPAAADRAAG